MIRRVPYRYKTFYPIIFVEAVVITLTIAFSYFIYSSIMLILNMDIVAWVKWILIVGFSIIFGFFMFLLIGLILVLSEEMLKDLECIKHGHKVRVEPIISDYNDRGVIFSGRCLRCRAFYYTLIPVGEVSLEIQEILRLAFDVSLRRRVEREVLENIRNGKTLPDLALRLYTLRLMAIQLRQLHRIGVERFGAMRPTVDLTELLKTIGVTLDIDFSARGVFNLSFRDGKLFIEAPHPLPYIWKIMGVGLDLIEVRAVEVIENVHANKVIALVKLVGKPFPETKILLDTVILGRDSTGPWMLRAHPSYWDKGLEEQLVWTLGLKRKPNDIEEA